MKPATRSAILAAPDLESETIEVPEWDMAVRILALDVNRRRAYFEYGAIVTRSDAGMKIETEPFLPHDSALAVLCIVDEKDQPLFTMADIEALGAKSPAVITRIADVARRLSRIRPEDQKAAKDALDPTNAGSPSGSPVTSE